MKVDALKGIRDSMKDVLKVLTQSGIVDSKLRSRYAEYLVGYKLAKRGHAVQLSGERQDKNADIYIDDIQKRVEVKSGKYAGGRAWASFGNGKQISKNKFDYCVFVTFDEFDESKVNEIFIFTRKELKEIAEHTRKDFAAHPKTNPCLLLRCRNFKAYEEYMDSESQRKLKIEISLNKHPKKYNRAWDKIK
ncbi:MAG: hypothetical protein WA102_01050 [Candidatus Methanoperedens sp.]